MRDAESAAAGAGANGASAASSGPPRLIAYGTLRPGGANHHIVAALEGVWRHGHVRGDYSAVGWGLTYGYPALIPREDGPAVEADLFESVELVEFWRELDAFEGPAYARVTIPFHCDTGEVLEGQAYVARERPVE